MSKLALHSASHPESSRIPAFSTCSTLPARRLVRPTTKRPKVLRAAVLFKASWRAQNNQLSNGLRRQASSSKCHAFAAQGGCAPRRSLSIAPKISSATPALCCAICRTFQVLCTTSERASTCLSTTTIADTPLDSRLNLTALTNLDDAHDDDLTGWRAIGACVYPRGSCGADVHSCQCMSVHDMVRYVRTSSGFQALTMSVQACSTRLQATMDVMGAGD